MDSLNVTDRFDGAAYWARLAPEDQAAIGAAALEWIAAEGMQDRAWEDSRPDWARVGTAAEGACRSTIQDVFVGAIDREGLEASDGTPRIPSLLGMVCRVCGCSEQDACPEGCGWAEDHLCTSCARKEG